MTIEQLHRRIPEFELAAGTELQYRPLGVRQVNNLPMVWKV